MILLSYKFKLFKMWGDALIVSSYELTVQKSYLFGLIKKVTTIDYTIPPHHNSYDYKEHWDNLILTKSKL